MNAPRIICLTATILLAAVASAADPTPVAAPPASTPPATEEQPYVGDTMELNAEQRQERAFRAIQQGMERIRSDRMEDEDVIVCVKQKPAGSNLSVVNCATNRFWLKIRESSMSAGIAASGMTPGGTGAYGAGGGGSARKDDKMVTLALSDFYKLEKRFGKLPKEMRDNK